MSFIADFHIHSPYSRATSKDLCFETLYQWATLKGVSLICTGDFTHPAWLVEIKEKLIPDGKGLFKLRDENIPSLNIKLPGDNLTPIRFIITCEISNIYKYKGKTRKVHNLICMPDFDSAARFANKLNLIGNIRSDGRPILGLDSRDLLEILLETSEEAVLVPAHIWTPWFSVLGSKSGFDSIEECYRDLSEHIFALETGLSSDPAMNWMVSKLDGYTLISNSDAHSAPRIGREANLFDCEMSYNAIMNALRHGSKKGFVGTLEFFPQEGKYHFDGHRKCDVCLSPEQSKRYKGICPSCGKPLTLGVMYRVVELADYAMGRKPTAALSYKSIVSLDKIVAEIVGSGSASKKVQREYYRLLGSLGTELSILLSLPLDSIQKHASSILVEAIRRVRNGRVHASPGFDGQYGSIQVFTEKERNDYSGQTTFFSLQEKEEDDTLAKKEMKVSFIEESDAPKLDFEVAKEKHQQSERLNEAQKEAVKSPFGPLLVIAGPGTGKTRTLVERIIWLINEKSVLPQTILAVTFFFRAAREMAGRIEAVLAREGVQERPEITTFHKLGLKIVIENHSEFELKEQPVVLSENDMAYLFSRIAKQTKDSGNISDSSCLEKRIIDFIEKSGDCIAVPADIYKQIDDVFGHYTGYKRKHGLIDFIDLLLLPLSLLTNNQEILAQYRQQWQHVFVDEYQDVNVLQYRLLRLLAPAGKDLFVIGDPDQAIYGFRGADVGYFTRFKDDYPDAHMVRLTRSYRSTNTILKASGHMISCCALANKQELWSGISGSSHIDISRLPTENSEAENVLKSIEELIGGSSHFAVDTGRSGQGNAGDISFGDIAILYRVHSVGDSIAEALGRSGIPTQRTARTSILDNKGVKATLACIRLIGEPQNIFHAENLFYIGIPGLSKHSAVRLINRLPSELSGNENIFDWLKKWGRLSLTESQAITHFEMNIQSVVAALRCKDLSKALEHAAFAMDIEEEELQQPHWLPLIQGAASCTDLSEFLTIISLGKDTDFYDPRVEGVTLMTLHASKGLEWKVVFIVGCEEGLIPYNEYNKKADLNEERRLFYVGMTRAKQSLFISYAESRKIRGRRVKRYPSSFLADIPSNIKNIKAPFSGKKAGKKVNGLQLELFK
jgi:uncharacterized protein (TIGR00375 family)